MIGIAAWLVATSVVSPIGMEQWRDEMTAHLLEGGRLPPEYRYDLMQMPPPQRFEAIVYLRRSGLLTGPSWAVEDLLMPAEGWVDDE